MTNYWLKALIDLREAAIDEITIDGSLSHDQMKSLIIKRTEYEEENNLSVLPCGNLSFIIFSLQFFFLGSLYVTIEESISIFEYKVPYKMFNLYLLKFQGIF